VEKGILATIEKLPSFGGKLPRQVEAFIVEKEVLFPFPWGILTRIIGVELTLPTGLLIVV